MLVSHLLLLGVILFIFTGGPPSKCRYEFGYYNNALETWPNSSVKEQIQQLYILKTSVFNESNKLELSPQVYKFGAKWEQEKNKVRFGKQPRPKSSNRWIIVRPSNDRLIYNGYVMHLPLNKPQVNEVMKLLTTEQHEYMTEECL